jgi:hypothetical protein
MKDSAVRYVVCAAIRRASDGAIICGVRHYDALMRATANREGGVREQWLGVEQGFVDNFGKWLTRQEAWEIAESQGQIRSLTEGDVRVPGTLFSEDLY